jgi:hypothetical protein
MADNFELTLQWKTTPGGNSGILYRVTENAITSWHVAPEMQVLDNTNHPNRDKRTTERRLEASRGQQQVQEQARLRSGDERSYLLTAVRCDRGECPCGEKSMARQKPARP